MTEEAVIAFIEAKDEQKASKLEESVQDTVLDFDDGSALDLHCFC